MSTTTQKHVTAKKTAETSKTNSQLTAIQAKLDAMEAQLKAQTDDAELLKMEVADRDETIKLLQKDFNDAVKIGEKAIKTADKKTKDHVVKNEIKTEMKQERSMPSRSIRFVGRQVRHVVPVTKKEAGQLVIGFGLGFITGQNVGVGVVVA